MRSWGRVLFVMVLLGRAAPALASETLTVAGLSGVLAGTLVRVPAPGAPAVLIIPGSGAVDRDGNAPPVVLASPYRLLADALAEQGISTLRVDKRGIGGSRAAAPDANHVTVQDYAADVHAWTDALKTRTGAGCVWLLGHSEGGLVALLAAQHDPSLCGLVLVATPGRPAGAVLREQVQANPANAPLLPQAMAAITALEAGRRVEPADLGPALMPLLRPAVQDFLVSAFRLDPATLIHAVHRPVLIVQGERDLQVGVADARSLAAAHPSSQLALLPDMNHVLKQVASGDRAANIASYADPSLPLAPGVADRIAAFLHQPGSP